MDSAAIKPDELRYAFGRVAAEAERAGGFIRWVKQYVRKAPPNRQECDINDIVREAANLAMIEARGHEATLRLDLTPSLPHVNVDRVQVEQVILNLVRNGLEALQDMPPAKRRVTIATRRATPKMIRVTVADNGPGVPETVRERVFDAFFSTKSSGTGLGLSLSRSIIERHDGKLSLADETGEGTVFCVELPVIGDSQPGSAE